MTKNIMIVGVGGQGTLLTSRIIGKAAMAKGYDVKISEVHGMAQRGGSVVTFVRFGDKVCEPVVEEGQADVIIAFERLEALRYAHFLKKDGVLVVNDCRIDPMTVVIGAKTYPEGILETLGKDHTVRTIDAQAIALALGNSKVLTLALQLLDNALRAFDAAFHVMDGIAAVAHAEFVIQNLQLGAHFTHGGLVAETHADK